MSAEPQHSEHPDVGAAVDVRSLVRHFAVRDGKILRAVDGVSFAVGAGEALAIVGESGSGKSTVARVIARLYAPTSGQVIVAGQDISRLRGAALRDARSRVQMVFQDPFASLNPVHTVEYHLRRPMDLRRKPQASTERKLRVHHLLETVGLTPPELYLPKFPHELSGGQRQRVAIARALALDPLLLLADEPTSMLDVSIRIGILNLLRDLVRNQHLAMVYITHDLAGARYVAQHTLVLYAGQVVEEGPTGQVIDEALHPYTRLLLSSVPVPITSPRPEPVPARGEIPDMTAPPSGCRFHPRCPFAMDVCRHEPPVWHERAMGHRVACHLYGDPTTDGTDSGRDSRVGSSGMGPGDAPAPLRSPR